MSKAVYYTLSSMNLTVPEGAVLFKDHDTAYLFKLQEPTNPFQTNDQAINEYLQEVFPEAMIIRVTPDETVHIYGITKIFDLRAMPNGIGY